MKAHCYYREGMAHQLRAMRSIATGLALHGVSAVVSPSWRIDADVDFVICWGDRVPEQIDLPRLILEAGYINGQSGDYHRDRLQFVSAGWNGLHNRADPVPFDCPPDRWQALGIEMTPWKTDPGYVLICDNHPGDRVAGPQGWWRGIPEAVKGEKVIYRPHPLIARDLPPLDEVLRGASRCVTWVSTSAVESVLNGIPTVAYAPGSIAWPVCSHDVSEPPWLGDRSAWAYNLAYRQWTHDELSDGTAWESLRHGV